MISSMGNFLPKKAVAAGGGGVSGLWVVVGEGGLIANSTDGNVWTAAATNVDGTKGGLGTYVYGVAYGNGRWIAVGQHAIIAGGIAISTDSKNWSPAGSINNFNGGKRVTYGKDVSGNGLWVSVGYGPIIIAKSTDGNVWTPAAGVANNKGGITELANGVAYGEDGTGNGLWVAVGRGGKIAKSTDGNVWNQVGSITGLGINEGLSVAYGKDNLGNRLWVVGGNYGLIVKSTDGNVWSTAAGTYDNQNQYNFGGITGSVLDVAYGKDGTGAGLWVAVGNGGLIAKSTNGNNWSPVNGPSNNKGGITNSATSVAYGKDALGNGLWVAVGMGGLIAKSTDGNVWTPAAGSATNKGGITVVGYGVAYNYTYTVRLTELTSTISQTGYGQPAISNSGKYILISITGGPSKAYVSNNYGFTFTEIATLGGFTNRTIQASAMSGTGQYMVVVFKYGNMFRSGNYGVSWQEVTNLSTQLYIWGSVALSNDGKYCLASANYDQNLPSYSSNNFFISSNFNTATPTFTAQSIYVLQKTTPSSNAISNNGQYMIQINHDENDVNFLSISSNYGSTFTNYSYNNIGLPSKYYPNMAMTPDASNIYLTLKFPGSGSGLYKSTNIWSGSPTFTEIKSTTFTENTWNYISTSSNGVFVVASTDVKTYYSTDSGLTWVVCYTGTLLYSAMSSDSYYVIASSNSNSKMLFSNR
jgi:hypothetical protein